MSVFFFLKNINAEGKNVHYSLICPVPSASVTFKG